MSDAIRILETKAGVAASETGEWIPTPKPQRDKGRRAFVQAKISSGDTLTLEGKVAEGCDAVVIATFDGTDDFPLMQVVDIPAYVRGDRATDGGAGEAELWIDVF